MACFYPLRGYMAIEPNENGKRPIVFSHRKGYIDIGYDIPCGQCGGCRKDKAKSWAVRCQHEASQHDDNCFVTLTYEHAPRSLIKKDFVLFMKRLRKQFGNGVRFFHVGEYGEKFGRPHHHVLFFGLDFKDKVELPTSGDCQLYRSPMLERLWQFGFSSIGDVTPRSVAYCTQYCYKKITGYEAKAYYDGRLPEYVTMSRRPGIGKKWIDKFGDETYRDDNVMVSGFPQKPPKFYDKKLEEKNKKLYIKIKAERKEAIKKIDRGDGERKRMVKSMVFNKLQKDVKHGK